MKAKKTLGILVSGIMDEYTKSICHGVVRQSQEFNMNTIIFPGKYIERDLSDNPELMYEYQFNTVFSYARPENVDVLICAIGSICSFTDSDGMKRFLEPYHNIPVILAGTKIDGYLSVTYDNTTGVSDGIRFLIEKRNCKNIGIISANTSNTDSMERQQAAIECIRDHGLAISPEQIVYGNLSCRSTAAYHSLLDHNPDLDAVFCVNDDTALGFYDALREYGKNPGKDVLVMGYDDTIAASKATPSLSTVHADGSLIGKEAVSMAKDLLEQKKIESRTIPAVFVLRDSFGTTRIHAANSNDILPSEPDVYFDTIFYRCDSMCPPTQIDALRTSFHKFITELEQTFTSETIDLPDPEYFSTLADTFFSHQNAIAYADAGELVSTLDDIQAILLQKQTSERNKFLLCNTFSAIYSRLYRAMDQQTGKIIAQEEHNNYSMKLFIRDMLQFEEGNDNSYISLLEHLNWLSIEHAALYLFDEPVIHSFDEPFTVPEEFYLKAVLNQHIVLPVPSEKQKYSLDSLFCITDQWDSFKQSYVLFPLFYNKTLYGLLLCDLTDALYVNGEFLVNQMSSAARMIHLLRINESIKKQLEDSLSILRQNNLALDTLSKCDPLTGILNRRGFLDASEKFLSECREKQAYSIVFYIDMNNLKIVNDRFGHDEGDFSISLIARYLTECVGNTGIAGRLGGDEFACLIRSSSPDTAQLFIETLYKKFDVFNQTGEKAYPVTVSNGFCIIAPDTDTPFHQLLSCADEQMYLAKQRLKAKNKAADK